jgi:Peptidase family M23
MRWGAMRWGAMWRAMWRRAGPLAPIVLLFAIFVPCASAWTWPVDGPVLQTFSFDPAHPYAAGQHRGIAIGADSGKSVLAPASGVVSFAGPVPTNGLTLTIQTGEGLAVSLTHLGSIGVARDVHVVEGAVVGTVGPSGTAEFATPYVHLGIRTASNDQGYLDPLDFLPVVTTPTPVKEPPAPVKESPAPVKESPSSVAPAAPAVSAPAAAAAATAPAAAAPAASAAAPQPVAAPAAPAAVPTASVEAPATPAIAEPAEPVERSDGIVMTGSRPRVAASQPAASHAQPAIEPHPLDVRGASPLRHGHVQLRKALGPPTVSLTRPATGAAAPHRASRPPVAPARPAPSPGVTPAARRASEPHRGVPVAIVALLALAAAAAGLVAARMIMSPSSESEGARAEPAPAEDPGRRRLAVRQRSAAPRARRRSRGPVRHLRAIPPAEGQRRGDGEWDGRARHPGDGVRRPGRRLAA